MKPKDVESKIAEYVETSGLCLRVEPDLSKPQFEQARKQAFLHAVQVWNEVDKTKRPRIKLPHNIIESLVIPKQDGIHQVFVDSDVED